LVPQVVGLFEPFPKIAGPDLNATRASEDRVGDLVEGDPHLRCVGGELLSAGRTLAKEGARLWDALIVLDLELADDAKDRGVPIAFRVRAVNPADSRHGKVMLRIIERAVDMKDHGRRSWRAFVFGLHSANQLGEHGAEMLRPGR